MKKLMIIAAMLMAVVGVKAQNEVGQFSIMPKAGVNIASLTKGDDAKSKIGLAVGVEAAYGVAKNFELTAGLLYSMQGAKQDGTDIKINMDYLNVPILAQYYLVKGLAVKAGVQVGFNTNAKLKNGDASADITNNKTVDFSVPVGLSYEISNVVLDARYNIGMTKVFEGAENKNSVIQITLGYKFPF